MNNQRNTQQQKFFNATDNQYAQTLILNPPYHTLLETNALLKQLTNINKKTMVIDFGAGSGRITIPLLQKGFSVMAVDISNNSLTKIKTLAKKLSLSSLQTSNALPKKKKAHAIVGADILHHIDLDEQLPAMYDSLEKGGIAAFSEPCAWNPTWHVYLRIASDWEVEKRMIYCSYFNLKKTFTRHGFRNVKISGLGVLPRPFFNWSQRISRLHDTVGNMPLLNLFAYRYIISATK